MSRPRRRDQRVGAPLSAAPEQALIRALAPMVREIRATLPSIRTPADATALGRALRKRWTDRRILGIMRKHGRTVEQVSARAWVRPRSDAAAYHGEKLVQGWAAEATGLITSVRNEVAIALRGEIVEALRVGTSPEDLAARWVARGIPVSHGTLEGRAKVIAKHQLRVLHAKIQRERASAVGVAKFWWRDQGDGNVRDLHTDISSGGPYDYDDPDTQGEGLPGEPVGCRCWAESIVPAEIAANLSAVFG